MSTRGPWNTELLTFGVNKTLSEEAALTPNVNMTEGPPLTEAALTEGPLLTFDVNMTPAARIC